MIFFSPARRKITMIACKISPQGGKKGKKANAIFDCKSQFIYIILEEYN